MANNRELSQFASFVKVNDTTQAISFASTVQGLSVSGVSTFSSLNISGLTTLGVTTTTGNVHITGIATVTGSLNIDFTNGQKVVAGKGANAGIHTYNTAFGVDSLQNVINGGQKNTAFGYRALQNATTTQQNVAIGYSALSGIDTSGYQNTAVGNLSLIHI